MLDINLTIIINYTAHALKIQACSKAKTTVGGGGGANWPSKATPFPQKKSKIDIKELKRAMSWRF